MSIPKSLPIPSLILSTSSAGNHKNLYFLKEIPPPKKGTPQKNQFHP